MVSARVKKKKSLSQIVQKVSAAIFAEKNSFEIKARPNSVIKYCKIKKKKHFEIYIVRKGSKNKDYKDTKAKMGASRKLGKTYFS